MRIICHVAAVHHGTGTVAVEWSDDGWLLPTYVLPPHTPHRPTLTKLAAALPMPAVPRCLAFQHVDKVTHTLDRLLIADAIRPGDAMSHSLTMMDMATLQRSRALVPYQLKALQRLNRPLTDAGIGLQPLWIYQVRNWVMDVAGLAPASLLLGADIYRANEYRVVVNFSVRERTLHFKVCGHDGVDEAPLTQFIADRCPTSAVPTIAYRPSHRWWLTTHVDGVHLEASYWPAQLTALDAWVALQRALSADARTLASLGVARFEEQQLRTAVGHAILAVESGRLPERVRRNRRWPTGDGLGDLVRARVERVLQNAVWQESPQGLLHFDFAPRNILWNGERPVFIDFETVRLGPASICGALMARRLKSSLPLSQRQLLSERGAHACLSPVTQATAKTLLGFVEALTDIHLLAFHHVAFSRRSANADPDAPPPYDWSHLASDFVSRACEWPIS